MAAVNVEVDEHSHGERKPECEGGKMFDTFYAIQSLAKTEREKALGKSCDDVGLTPQFFFIRFNPNACDAPGGIINLTLRIQVLAKRVSELLQTPYEEYERRSKEWKCMAPYLEVLYYHSRQGANNLEHYKENREATSR